MGLSYRVLGALLVIIHWKYLINSRKVFHPEKFW